MARVNAMICGVMVKGMTVMPSKFPGYDPHAGEPFPAGATIAYLPKDALTDEQVDAIFPNGKVYPLSVQWPLKARAAQTKRFSPSVYQKRVLDAAVNETKNLFLAAYAGCAKTSTLVWLVQELNHRKFLAGKKVVYLAFNKSIQEELSEFLKGTGVPALTTHSFGLRLLSAVYPNIGNNINNSRIQDLFILNLMDECGLPYSDESSKKIRTLVEYRYKGAVDDLAGFVKNWAIIPDLDEGFTDKQKLRIEEFIDDYKIDLPNINEDRSVPLTEEQEELVRINLVKFTCDAVYRSIPKAGESLPEISYDDMLYLPLALGLEFPAYDFVLTDESQDFNTCQLAILTKMSLHARIVSVGDEFQSLYLFRGADSQAFPRIREMFSNSKNGYTELSLPLNYRCDQLIIKNANRWVPELEGASKAFGTVSTITLDQAFERANNDGTDIALPDGVDGQMRSLPLGDKPTSFAFLCRTNVPLIVAAYKLIGQRKRITIVGRNQIGRPLKNLIIELCGDDEDDENYTNRIADVIDEGQVIEYGLITRARNYLSLQMEKFKEEKYKNYIEEVTQKVACIEVIAARVADNEVSSVLNEIDMLFSEKPEPGVITLSTIHRAKGLEWDVVFILRPDLLPHPNAKPNPDGSWSDAQQQEQNAQYVAGTRPRHRLYYVTTWDNKSVYCQDSTSIGEINQEYYGNFDNGYENQHNFDTVGLQPRIVEKNGRPGIVGQDGKWYPMDLEAEEEVLRLEEGNSESSWQYNKPTNKPITKIDYVDDGKPF